MNTFRLKRNLDEAVYEQILSSIFEGKFHSGEQVQIERLCEQYEISRTPVIQALKRLATDGIVETSPTGKFFFPAADERRVRDMMEMRLRSALQTSSATSASPPWITVSPSVRRSAAVPRRAATATAPVWRI